ncbi:MAG: pilus assembly protein [Betaproteobacteria bacterium]|nr:pilus assembly protein [Betaproteobacteria bacterium]
MRNTDKPNRLKATLIAAAIAVLPLATHAAGLGKITVLSGLGQPLRAELEVTATRDEATSLVARVAAVEAFRQAGIEYSPALANLRFSRDIKERGGRRYLEISTDRPLNEPFIDMLVELNWASGRLVREYTFLLDPPDLASKAPPVPVAAPEARAEPAPASAPAQQEKPAAPVAAESRPVVESPRPTSVQPALRPAGDNLRTVVAGDTLGKIAAQTRPEGVSLDQMLVALFRSNRDLFDAGNMNRIKAGKILSIPDAETARAVDPTEARREIVAQSADFNAYRQRLATAAAAAPAQDQTAKQAVSGKIAPKIEDKAPVATGKDKLEVSRTEAARDAKGKPLQGRITALEEDLVSRERALKEAGGRIAELEKNLSDLQKLAAIKSQSGADLQKAAAAPAAKPAEPPKPVEAAKPAEPPQVAEAAKPADAAKPAEAAKPADAAAPAPEAPKPAAPKKKVTPPSPPPEPDFMEENGPLVFGGGALLALLFGWLGITAYRKKRAAKAKSAAPILETDLSVHSVFSTTSTSVAPPPSEQETSQFSTTAMGMAASQETVDPVVEADTFLAFGRDAQAEEILLEALKTEPQRQAIHLKLLDIYAARKDAVRFEEVAQDLHALTGDTGDVWNKVAAMGVVLTPGSSLFASAAPAEPEPAAAAAPDLGETTVLGDTARIEVPAPAVAAPPALDFDLDIGTAPAAGAASAAAPEASGLDFDLDLGASETAPAPQVAGAAAVKSEELSLDINFDMPSKATEAPAPQAAAPVPAAPAAAADSGSIDFDFDLGNSDAQAAPLPEMSIDIAMPPATPALDLGGLSLELDKPAGAAPAAAVADNPEVATKLELAAAYEEMGDHDGARELLQEAVKEGSPAQQEVARAKLASFG